MQTTQEVIDWIDLRLKELIVLEYQLLDSFYYLEIDGTVRSIKKHTADYSEKLFIIKNLLTNTTKDNKIK